MTRETPEGDNHAAAELAPLVYEELRAIARRYMRRERGYQTLQPTALVNEAYYRLASGGSVEWRGKTHFLAVAATQMRRILVERARAAGRIKRGEGRRRITLDDDVAPVPERTVDVLVLDEALGNLATRSERQARVAEMRLFSGMLVREIASTLEVSDRTVKEDWRFARAWLARELESGRGRYDGA
jgi:RNA polymerase sigma factor (TIGR02999 family)